MYTAGDMDRPSENFNINFFSIVTKKQLKFGYTDVVNKLKTTIKI